MVEDEDEVTRWEEDDDPESLMGDYEPNWGLDADDDA